MKMEKAILKLFETINGYEYIYIQYTYIKRKIEVVMHSWRGFMQISEVYT